VKLEHYGDWGISYVFIKNDRAKVPLQRYWTTRYVITLFIGLIIIAFVSAIWIRHQALENRLELMEFMAEETANRFLNINDKPLTQEESIKDFLEERGQFKNMESNPFIYITTSDGIILTSNRPVSPLESRINPTILSNASDIQKIPLGDEQVEYYIIKKPIQYESFLFGWVVIAETEANLLKVNQEYQQLFIMIIGLAILGWIVIYYLSRKLAKPIKEVAHAAREVQGGNYNIQLPNNMKIEELDELIVSFRAMSEQLQKLESLRNELLAGVTHELKTPVTSISGLLQAVNEGIVEGEEAKEFLNISLKESTKMKKMVEDLLAFNSFVANAVPLNMEHHIINKLVKDIVYQWELTQKEPGIKIEINFLTEPLQVKVDSIRLQQIITNLLNNAQQSMDKVGHIDVIIGKQNFFVTIDIKDTGSGIPEEEQSLIFERFYRGEGKKFKVGGLGLGLPFSKMIAQAMGGNLELLSSSSSGTTFRIYLPLLT
jgi:signal transduction histidine kinase